MPTARCPQCAAPATAPAGGTAPCPKCGTPLRGDAAPRKSGRTGKVLLPVCAGLVLVGGAAGAAYWFVLKPPAEKGREVVNQVEQPVVNETVPPAKAPAPAEPAPRRVWGVQPAPEPRRVYGSTRDDPVVIATVDEMVDRSFDLKGKWVRVTGMVDQVTSLAGDTIGSVYAVDARPQLVIFHFGGGAWKKDLVGVNDVIEVTGKLENPTATFTTLSQCELVKRTPAKAEPPVEITATDLTKEFAADPAAAHAKFKTKYLKVTGQVRLKAGKAAPGGILGLDGVKDPRSNFNLRVVASFVADQKAGTDATQMGSTIAVIGRIGNAGLQGHDLRLDHCRLAK